MNDISTKFPVLAAGLQKASARFKPVEDDDPKLQHARVELQRELANLREYVRNELQSVRDFGIDVPGFDDDAPGDLIDLCNALEIDPHCRFDELLSGVRAWALRRRLEAQVDAAALKTGDAPAPVNDEATENVPEWSAWIRKAEWGKVMGISESTVTRRVKKHGETNPNNRQEARFPIQWLKHAGHSIPSTVG